MTGWWCVISLNASCRVIIFHLGSFDCNTKMYCINSTNIWFYCTVVVSALVSLNIFKWSGFPSWRHRCTHLVCLRNTLMWLGYHLRSSVQRSVRCWTNKRGQGFFGYSCNIDLRTMQQLLPNVCYMQGFRLPGRLRQETFNGHETWPKPGKNKTSKAAFFRWPILALRRNQWWNMVKLKVTRWKRHQLRRLQMPRTSRHAEMNQPKGFSKWCFWIHRFGILGNRKLFVKVTPCGIEGLLIGIQRTGTQTTKHQVN